MAFYRCSYILRTDKECNRGCYHPKGCKVHRNAPPRVPCKECGKSTYSDYGFCDPHAKKHRRMAEYFRKKLEKLAESMPESMPEEKEALIDNNAKLHASVKELENKYLDDHDRICRLEDSVGDLEIATEDIGYQSEENDVRIAKLEQTQKSYN
nr:4719_t:CDS:2 [Entrophospora candida]